MQVALFRTAVAVSVALSFALGVIALAACRGNFDRQPDATPPPPPDAMLPELVCAAQANAIPAIAGTLASVDLAVTSQDLRYLAAWTDPAVGSVTAAQLDRTRTLVGAPRRVLEEGVLSVAGLEAVSDRIWMVTATPPAQTVWSLSSDLTAVTAAMTEQSIAGVESIAVATTLNDRPIWVRGGFDDKTIRLSYLMSNGDVGVFATYAAPAKVTMLSFSDYTNHAHLGWRTEEGNCFSSDVIFGTAPTIPDQLLLTSDCVAMRVTSGPPPHDPLVMTWSTGTGDIFIRYDGSTIPDGGSAFTVKLGNGRAPKITFDGEAYWVAWLDDTGLRFSRIDKTGVVRTSGFLGDFPAGDEAFELVARGVAVDLVVLKQEQLTFYTLCASAS